MRYFKPSSFDDIAAPHLVGLLARVSDARVVATIGRHLQNKPVSKHHYGAVLEAFKSWATRSGETGWVLGDTLARMSNKSRVQEFLDLAARNEYGSSRALIVMRSGASKRPRTSSRPWEHLSRDPDVSLYATAALQRTIGAGAMAEVLRGLIATCKDDTALSVPRA